MSETYRAGEAAGRYDSARSLPPETAAMWTETLRSVLPLARVHTILDLGAGTGRFATVLNRAFECRVVAVDPSESMLDQIRSRGFPEITWKRGSGECIPLENASVDLVWMSQVFHHLDDPARTWKEVRRVLTPGGFLVIRNGTCENDEVIEWSRCFPEARRVSDECIPSRQHVVATVRHHGFRKVSVQTVYQFQAPSWAEYYEKISQRGLSAMISITDEESDAGLER